jgi:hypothetical protein
MSTLFVHLTHKVSNNAFKNVEYKFIWTAKSEIDSNQMIPIKFLF